MKKEESCRIEFKKHGLEIAGPCAQGFSESSEAMFRVSKAIEREVLEKIASKYGIRKRG